MNRCKMSTLSSSEKWPFRLIVQAAYKTNNISVFFVRQQPRVAIVIAEDLHP